MELLAPAGSVETFRAAIEAGADAVYVGAPGFNARNLAKDLRLEEIGAMIRHCRRLDKKLYVAANSLILDRELPQVIETLALIQELAPDGLIAQDLGLLRLVGHHFPKLRLHGSTLMTAHNSLAVRFLAELGCERVVLARELTLKEIEAIGAGCRPTEVEVFVHGAMCFSYSGLCLFSSYLGGKSGLRGRCVQPCRRAYRLSGGKGEGGRYLFSMNDLAGLELVPQLRAAGVASLKIEGRMRSAHYVHSIVSAYRLLIDAPPEDWDSALAEARRLADQAMSRKTSPGYFLSPQPPEAITPHHSGNLGLHLGRFSAVRQAGELATCRFVTKAELAVGDRLRLHVEPAGERTAFTLKSLYVLGHEQDRAPAGSKVSIELPPGLAVEPGGHVEVYKVDTAGRPGADQGRILPVAEVGRELAAVRHRLAAAVDRLVSRLGGEGGEAGLPAATQGQGSRQRRAAPPRSPGGRSALEWWLKTDSVKLLLGDLPFAADRLLLSFTRQTASQAGTLKGALGRRMRQLTWALPPLIMENDLPRVVKQLRLLIRSGFRSFQLGHLSQVALFGDEKVHLYADYTANLFNSQALALAGELGIEAAQAGIELDRESLRRLLGRLRAEGAPKIPIGLTVYGAPPLYTSRLAPQFFPFDRLVVSPKDEPYVIRRMEGGSQTFPEKPFSLLPFVDELREMGLRYAVVDLCGLAGRRRDLQELADRLRNTGRYPKLSTFNYLGTLE